MLQEALVTDLESLSLDELYEARTFIRDRIGTLTGEESAPDAEPQVDDATQSEEGELDDKRAHPRFTTRFVCKYVKYEAAASESSARNLFRSGTVLDISKGGVRFATDGNLTTGDNIILLLYPNAGVSKKLYAEVVWITSENGQNMVGAKYVEHLE